MTGVVHQRSDERERILSEIQALAQESGVAPSRKLYEERYGSAGSAFQGRLWARWGDAVREAGLEPRSLPDKTPDESLLRAMADLCNELGRFPTLAELDLRRVTHSDFPARAVIQRRFGNAESRRAAVRRWAAGKPGYAEVTELLASNRPDDDQPATPAAEGYVYMLVAGGDYKIGMSASVGRRWAEIASAFPRDVELVHYFRTDDPAGIERYWHQRFREQRTGGEWFSLAPSQVAAFKRRRKFM